MGWEHIQGGKEHMEQATCSKYTNEIAAPRHAQHAHSASSWGSSNQGGWEHLLSMN